MPYSVLTTSGMRRPRRRVRRLAHAAALIDFSSVLILSGLLLLLDAA